MVNHSFQFVVDMCFLSSHKNCLEFGVLINVSVWIACHHEMDEVTDSVSVQYRYTLNLKSMH